MKKVLFVLAMISCFGAHAQVSANRSTVKYQSLQRIKIVKIPARNESSINAQVASLDARMQAAQASVQKAQDDLAALKAAQDKLKGELDSMNEMSEETSMRLQIIWIVGPR